MGKLKNIKSGMRVILTAIALFVASVPTFAGWRIVIDRNCIATVGANLASQKLIRFRYGESLLQGNRKLRLRYPQRRAGTY